mgnify:CR=1 FL=1
MNLQLAELNYDVSRLKPVTSELSFSSHMGIYKKYVTDYNNSVGDIPFNKAGAFLHKLYFENIRESRQNNIPLGRVAEIIQTRYGTMSNFNKMYLETVNKLQGSGWVFMNTSGYLNIIPNNRIVDNVALLIDFWEHAYYPTWGSDREAYAQNHLNIINWDIVNKRIADSRKPKEERK